jgi:hypothetical protein
MTRVLTKGRESVLVGQDTEIPAGGGSNEKSLGAVFILPIQRPEHFTTLQTPPAALVARAS